MKKVIHWIARMLHIERREKHQRHTFGQLRRLHELEREDDDATVILTKEIHPEDSPAEMLNTILDKQRKE